MEEKFVAYFLTIIHNRLSEELTQMFIKGDWKRWLNYLYSMDSYCAIKKMRLALWEPNG